MAKETVIKGVKVNYGIIVGILFVAAAFLIGRLSAQVEYLKGGAGTVALTQTAQPTGAAQGQPTKPAIAIDQIKALFNGKNITFGDKNRKVIFLEFSDPSCPYCHVAGGLNGALNKQMGGQFTLVADGGTYVAPVPEMRKLVDSGKAAFVWVYANGHGDGEMATRALYCAYEKGKFWQVHDLLMSEKGYEILNGYDFKQQPINGPVVKNDKTKSGDLADFLTSAISARDMKNCLDSGKYDSKIADDMAIATDFGFQGTPDFYVNTQNYVGAQSFKDMQSVVDAALK